MVKGLVNRVLVVYFLLLCWEIFVLMCYQGQNGIQCYCLLVLVENFYCLFYYVGGFFIGVVLMFDCFMFIGQVNLNGVVWFDWFNKVQVFYFIVGDNWFDVGIDEQFGCGGDQEIVVDYLFVKN